MKIKKFSNINEEFHKYTKKEIEKLIENVEWEFKFFERPSAANSEKMLKIIKQLIKHLN